MRVEHVALNVPDPVALVRWYVKHLGYRVLRSMDAPPYMHFIADESGHVVFEVYRNDSAPVPDYPSQDPLVLHLAYASDDIAGDKERLLAAGATVQADTVTTPAGDQLCMLRDPWGVPIQLVSRDVPLA